MVFSKVSNEIQDPRKVGCYSDRDCTYKLAILVCSGSILCEDYSLIKFNIKFSIKGQVGLKSGT